MGRLRTERSSERKHAANRANARRPRGRWAGTPERAAIDEAKRLLREAIPEGAAHLAALIRDSDTPAELRLQAFKLAADRVGMPVLTQSEVMMQEPPIPQKLLLIQCPECRREHGPRWPGPEGAEDAAIQSLPEASGPM